MGLHTIPGYIASIGGPYLPNYVLITITNHSSHIIQYTYVDEFSCSCMAGQTVRPAGEVWNITVCTKVSLKRVPRNEAVLAVCGCTEQHLHEELHAYMYMYIMFT
jgi:hypothetical protein